MRPLSHSLITLFLLPILSSATGMVQNSEKTAQVVSKGPTNDEAPFDVTFSLVSFQLKNSEAEHLIAVVDNKFQEASSIVKASFELGVGVTLMTYESGELVRYLETFYHSNHAKKAILLAYSENITERVFQEINDNRLETGYFRWFVLTEIPIDENIKPFLFEENQVVILEGERKARSKIHLKTMKWNVNNVLSFEDTGWMAFSEGFKDGVKMHIRRHPVFPTIVQKYTNLHGRKLKVAANNHIVYFRQRTLENGELAPWEGVDVNIVKELSKVYNFTFEVVHPKDGRWGGPAADGSISGLIGLVARHEAHMAIHEITINEIRDTVVDFSKPYYTEGSTLVSKAPEYKNLALAVVTPFSFPVWCLIFASLFIMGFAVMLIDMAFLKQILKEEEQLNFSYFGFGTYFSYYLFNTFRTLVIQGNKIKCESSSIRVVLGIWFLTCIIITALYSGNLCAVFAAPSFFEPINSLLDLLRAARDGNVYPIATAGTAISYLFQLATFGTHKEIYQYFDPVKSHVGYNERFLQAANGKAVILSSKTSNIIKTNIYGRDKYHVGTEQFFYQSYGIALPTGSPFKIIFSKTLQNLIEAGLIDKWVDEAVTNELNYIGIIGGDRGNVMSRRNTENKSISIVQLQAAFFILGIGFVLAFFAFLLFEILAHKIDKRQ